jgi:uncharacterized protein involved in tolerance to divalent cations
MIEQTSEVLESMKANCHIFHHLDSYQFWMFHIGQPQVYQIVLAAKPMSNNAMNLNVLEIHCYTFRKKI